MRRLNSPGLWASAALLLMLACPAPSVRADGVVDEPETVVAERVSFGPELTTKGVFVPSSDVQHVSFRPKAYRGPLKIESYTPKAVKGEPVLTFETTEIDEAIERTEVELALAKIKHQRLEAAFQLKKEEFAIERLEAERKQARTAEELRYFLEVSKPMRIEESKHGIEGRRDRIEDQKEELAQLEKMYGEDDLTEETEEIVLMRARRSLKRALKSLGFAEERHRRFLEVTLPRDEEDRVLGARKAAMALQVFNNRAARQLDEAELEMVKARDDLRNREERLTELRADREGMSVKATVSGTAVPGIFSAGKWSGRDTTAVYEGGTWTRRLGGAEMVRRRLEVRPGTVVLTVVPGGIENARVRVKIDEGELFRLEVGSLARVTPSADKSASLRAKVLALDPFGSNGKHDVVLQMIEWDKRLAPGMSCEVALVRRSELKELSLPASCFTELDGQTVVYVVGADGPKPVPVVPGRSAAGRISIAKGIEAGARVLLNPPQGD